MPRRSSPPVELAGTDGEAGAAVVRTALSLAAATRQSFTMQWDPSAAGLPAGGDVAVRALLAAHGGSGEGAETGSRFLSYRPGPKKQTSIVIDAAGHPVAPVLEMIVPPLALAGTATQVRLTGLTHGHDALSFHDVAYGWLPLAERIGVAAEIVLGSAGFAPDGAGIVEARVFPTPRLKGLELSTRGLLVETQALALVANLGIGIALPLERRLTERLRASGIVAQVEALPMPSDRSRGLASVVLAQFERLRIALVAVGQTGHPPEEVADLAVSRLQGLLGRRGAVPGDVAERLLVLLALAASPFAAPGAIGADVPSASRVTITEVTPTLLTVADVVRKMLPVEVQVQGLPGDDGLLEVRPRAS